MEGEKSSQVERLAVELAGLIEELAPRLEGEADETKRYLVLVGNITGWMAEKGLGRIVVTGGFAVEVYTGRTYRTMDVDLIAESPEAADVLEKALSMVGEKLGRGYLPRWEALAAKSIDIVSSVYDRPADPVELEVEGLKVYLDPPEVLVVRYLSGWKHWEATEDRDKALWLLAAARRFLDRGLLETLAREAGVEDRLVELEKLLESLG